MSGQIKTTQSERDGLSRDELLEAVRNLIIWIGDDPDREGLVDTPDRVLRSYEDFFWGYKEDPEAILERTFEEVAGYNDIVLVKDIRLESHCEHHMVPIIGKAHVAYIPNERVVGISKLARVVDIYAKRLQTQETLTAQIGTVIEKVLKPKGVAVLVDAEHQCMSTRGVRKPEAKTVTRHISGLFQDDTALRMDLLSLFSS